MYNRLLESQKQLMTTEQALKAAPHVLKLTQDARCACLAAVLGSGSAAFLH